MAKAMAYIAGLPIWALWFEDERERIEKHKGIKPIGSERGAHIIGPGVISGLPTAMMNSWQADGSNPSWPINRLSSAFTGGLG